MPTCKSFTHVLVLGLAAIPATASAPRMSLAQDAATKANPDPNQGHLHKDESPEASLVQQLRVLQSKVAKLEAALKQNHQGTTGMDAAANDERSPGGKSSMGMGMGMMSKMRGMSGTGMGMMSGKGAMGMGGMAGKGMMEHPGMKMMGRMKGMGSMQMKTALPGFPGASHIYHIGATAFFLDHPQHITLAAEQHKKLNEIKERTLLAQATFDRWIEQAEQEIWVLTSADVPDAAKVEAKIREVAKLGADKRVAYIRAVGEAASVLTDSQRETLVGRLPADHAVTPGKVPN